MKVADVSDRVRQAVLATAGEGMWNAGAFYAELDPFTLVLAFETQARHSAESARQPRRRGRDRPARSVRAVPCRTPPHARSHGHHR